MKKIFKKDYIIYTDVRSLSRNTINAVTLATAKGHRKNYVAKMPIYLNHNGRYKIPSAVLKRTENALLNGAPHIDDRWSLRTIISLAETDLLRFNTRKGIIYPCNRGIVVSDEFCSNIAISLITGLKSVGQLSYKFIVNSRTDEKYFCIEDGEQRTFSIVDIFTNKIKFTGTNTVFDGHYFKELPSDIQYKILSAEVNVNISVDVINSFAQMNLNITKPNTWESIVPEYYCNYVAELDKVKDNPYLATIVGNKLKDYVVDGAKGSVPYKNRQEFSSALAFAHANIKFSPKECPKHRDRTGLQEKILSYYKDKKVSKTETRKDIQYLIELSELIYSLFGYDCTKEYVNYPCADGTKTYISPNDGYYHHKSKLSQIQLNCLFLTADMLYRSENLRKCFIYGKEISDAYGLCDIKKCAKDLADKLFTSPDFILKKGSKNGVPVYIMDTLFAERVRDAIMPDIQKYANIVCPPSTAPTATV